MEYSADYARIDWENYSSTRTPLNASNLNKMDAAIKKHDEAILELFESGGGGTSDYAELENKPQINGQTLNAGNNEFPFLTEENDPTVPAWAKEPNKPTYTAEEVGALPSDTPIPDPTSVEINRFVSIGTHIADITVNGEKTELYAPTGGGGGGGVSSYGELPDKPSINGHTLVGSMTSEDLGIIEVTEEEKANWNSKASQSSVDALASLVGQANAMLEEV